MQTEIVASIIGGVGIGAIAKGIFDTYVLDRKKRNDQARHEFKEVRYKALLILCHCLINFEKEKGKLKRNRPEIVSKEELFDELYLEWVNMTLYASDKVILTMQKFLENPTQINLNETILAMRMSLYDIKSKLKAGDLQLSIQRNTQG